MCTDSHANACCVVGEWQPGRVWQRSLGVVKKDPVLHAGVCIFYPKSRGDLLKRCKSSCIIKPVYNFNDLWRRSQR